KVIYVSCNPSTMARDISLMKEVYDIKEVQPIDMFPHTYHIEAVCRLEKKSNGY
ncbi:MAG: 23S rRNA (uracil(1939)-C(5))-methyltransferase RlmD, partial [Deltaproteobacteria bacterium]|nr:23S rRNA (uracil(1939)-C(5))-methyltransferase RlmD [Deltaproteobacteria bacterium]